MKEVKEFLNKEEKKMVDNIEIYLNLNDFELKYFERLKSKFWEGVEFYRYQYKCQKRGLFILIIEYCFSSSNFDKVYLHQFCDYEFINTKMFKEIRDFRDFLSEII